MSGKKWVECEVHFCRPFFYHRTCFKDGKTWSARVLPAHVKWSGLCGYIELPRHQRAGRPSGQRVLADC